MTSYKKQHREKRIEIFALSLVSVLLTFVFVVFHIIASIKLIKYGNEVLYDNNDDYGSVATPIDGKAMENDDHTYNIGRDHQCVPIVYAATSFIPTISLTFILILKYVELYYSGFKDADKSLGIFLHISLGGFLVYLGFYFLP